MLASCVLELLSMSEGVCSKPLPGGPAKLQLKWLFVLLSLDVGIIGVQKHACSISELVNMYYTTKS